jgi:RHS repeat-associated protein
MKDERRGSNYFLPMNPRYYPTKDDARVKNFSLERFNLSGTSQGAGGVGGLLEISYYGSSTTDCFPAYDGNGNVMACINAADGAGVAQLDYDPFLGIIRATGPMANLLPFLGSTKYYDWETRKYYFGCRYLGDDGWLSRDPSQEQGGLNLYSFVGSDSTNDIDSYGLVDCKFEVVHGNHWPFNGGILGGVGEWGQPGFAASGNYDIESDAAYSTVIITGRVNPWFGAGNACNTISDLDPAGTIYMYLRNDCPGYFNVGVYCKINTYSSGSNGAANASFSAGQYSLHSTATRQETSNEADGDFIINVFVNTEWKNVATYLPTISEGGVTSGPDNTGEADGEIKFNVASQ